MSRGAEWSFERMIQTWLKVSETKSWECLTRALVNMSQYGHATATRLGQEVELQQGNIRMSPLWRYYTGL